MKTALFFYYKKITVVGKELIPKQGAILFIGNHQNALIDPLLVATNNPRELYFLTRAAVFKNKIAKWWLSTVNMLPIYRIRDGKSELAKNNAIFDTCFELLKDEKTVLIFPEGSHNIIRRVRPLSKGYTRILFGALDKYPNLQINIVPIGFNFEQATAFPSKVALHYGKPINVNQFYNTEDVRTSIEEIKKVSHTALTKLTTHIADTQNYDAIHTHLKAINTNFLAPQKVNKTLENLDLNKLQKSSKTKSKKHWLYSFLVLNNLVAWLLWKRIEPKVKEIEFKSTIRFAIGISLAPLMLVLKSLLVYICFGSYASISYFALSLLLVFAYSRTK